jgi:hypothetical protein
VDDLPTPQLVAAWQLGAGRFVGGIAEEAFTGVDTGLSRFGCVALEACQDQLEAAMR